MKKLSLIYINLMVLLFTACSQAPVTHRSQMIFINNQEEIAEGLEYSKIILSRSKLSDNVSQKEMVKHVGENIAKAVNQEYGTSNYKWNFYLIENKKRANAFCFAGGQVFVYDALFNYIENEDELAIVMGHEIAHALARHHAEKKTSSKLAKAGNGILNFLDRVSYYNRIAIPLEKKFNKKMNKKLIDEWIMLPHSRTQEYEADKIGLFVSTKAGYDPKASISFWKKFAKEESNDKPEYQSTHPNPSHRIEALEKLIPLVQKNKHKK